MAVFGVRRVEDLPALQDLPPARTRCCHACGRERGKAWQFVVSADFTLGTWPFCDRCIRIGLDIFNGENCVPSETWDATDRRVVIRITDWQDNYERWREAQARDGATNLI